MLLQSYFAGSQRVHGLATYSQQQHTETAPTSMPTLDEHTLHACPEAAAPHLLRPLRQPRHKLGRPRSKGPLALDHASSHQRVVLLRVSQREVGV